MQEQQVLIQTHIIRISGILSATMNTLAHMTSENVGMTLTTKSSEHLRSFSKHLVSDDWTPTTKEKDWADGRKERIAAFKALTDYQVTFPPNSASDLRTHQFSFYLF